jgi:predicted nucleic acid-binding protein
VILYVETSALIKAIIQEPGSDIAVMLWDAAEERVTSRITYPEGRAALAAANRAGRLTDPAHSRAKTQLGRLIEAMGIVELTETVALGAGDLAELHGMRGYDAVHIASALEAWTEDLVFATWDAELVQAAATVGIATSRRYRRTDG